MTPNLFAYLALVAWPLVALYLYLSGPAGLATMWTILAGQLLLPVGTFFKFEMIPQFDKVSIPNLCALIGCTIAAQRPPRITNGMGVVEVLILLCVVSPLPTSLLNGDPIHIGSTVLPGVGLYDGISAVIFQLIMLIPFFLGRRFFRNAADTQQLFSVLSFAGLAYSVLLLFEIRFSPQLHNWVYGYHPTNFEQEVRESGFRPMVFMGHGLVACFFAMTAAVASAALWRARFRAVRFAPAGAATAYLSAVLVLCKSSAATVYGMVLVPLVVWTTPRLQMCVAVFLVSIALLYPFLRMYDVFPTQTILGVADSIDPARASSLELRFREEGRLLNRASERFMLGWGRFGRNRIFVEDWRGIGGDSSITDGLWVIVLGQFGLVGFIAEFGLLAISVFRAAKALKFAESLKDSIFLSALALIVAVNIIDLLPNSALSPWSWLLVGTLLGRSEMMLARSRNRNLRTASPPTVQEARA
ncbi:hypothetical protein [Bradyrhizobium erythrophlei]|uniref:O-Antigen ligase n=1 Tax=Bradyrhizobium erythrophlei TaxID=1437360 RepID=A0A1M5TGX1_9BRAD|nr:hypothetical protein [Bradyrhizobium erythrophlei]SHH49593.1 hypothetical protein SAMN05443248_5001 [Bradyrhizobium erythrophlei]